MSEIVFQNAKDAVRWADEIGIKSDMKSQIGSLGKTSMGVMSKEDAKDHALTITSKVNNCQAPMSKMFLCVYGSRDIDREITVARLLANKISGKTASSYPLALALIESERKRYHTNSNLSRSMLAKIAGVPYQTFRGKKWLDVELKVTDALHQWLEIADREITLELKLLGYVS